MCICVHIYIYIKGLNTIYNIDSLLDIRSFISECEMTKMTSVQRKKMHY